MIPLGENEPQPLMMLLTDRYIYSQVCLEDANMRLSHKYVSSDTRDPGLGTGLAYFVADTPYKEHLKKYGCQSDVSSWI